MDIFQFFSTFFYRIRYKLIIGTGLVLALTFFLTDFLPKYYEVSTIVFTGITSKSSVDETGRSDWNSSNNAHENIINLVKSKNTKEMVSMKLVAQHLMYGDENKDTKYIMASHYKWLKSRVPPEVVALVVKDSMEKTVENFIKYKKEDKSNFIYGVFNWDNPYYGAVALSSIKVARKGVSDMIEITYQCDDPGIATYTLEFLCQELTSRYESLLLSTSNDVVKHFEGELIKAKRALDAAEDILVAFNIDNKIINYEEQTKHLAALNNNFESRYEDILLTNSSSQALLKELEHQMTTRTVLIKENEDFLKSLDSISTLNGKIAEIEIFGNKDSDNQALSDYKNSLQSSEKNIKNISNNIESYTYTKEGIGISDMVTQWLDALLKSTKSTAELKVMAKRKAEIQDQYGVFSPVGPNLNRHDREVRVQEEAYLTILHHLGLAKLKQKNILLDAGTLQVVAPADYPLLCAPRRRELYMIAALLGAIIFITGFYLLIEMLDRTVRDGLRAERLTSCKVIGAFPSGRRVKYRRFIEDMRKTAITHIANIFNVHLITGKPFIINILSMQSGEGKSFIADRLDEYWVDHGFNVKYISDGDGFDQQSKEFMQSTSISELPMMDKAMGCDVIIVEYAPLNQTSIPKHLLNEASVNLLIVDAERAWMSSDKELMANLKESVMNDSIQIYLNNADCEAVEQYVGQLPPYTLMRRLSYKLFNFGLTARS